MAASFIETFQNLASSITLIDTKNCFTWDKAIRKFQYTIAGIMLATLTIFESTISMECSSPVDNSYASSFCREAKWYYVGNSTGHKPYDEFLRYFKWYILIPPLITIIFTALYDYLVNGYLVHAISSAARIKDIWEKSLQNPSTFDDTGDVNKTIITMAMCSRIFAESNLPYCVDKCLPKEKIKKEVKNKDGEKMELKKNEKGDEKPEEHDDDADIELNRQGGLGQKTALYFNMYVITMFLVNLLAVIFFNPLIFSFPESIACKFRSRDMVYRWSICSVPGHRYARVAVIIIMLNHIMGVLSSIMSLIYLNIYIPRVILTADSVIEDYTRRIRLQKLILDYWYTKGRDKIKMLTSTSKFILALIYQNIGRLLCFRLVLALVDIEKDEGAVNNMLRDLINRIADSTVTEDDRGEIINEIRDIILNPLSIDMISQKIESVTLKHYFERIIDDGSDRVLTKVPQVQKALLRTQGRRALLKAQQVLRITGVQLKLDKDEKEKFQKFIEKFDKNIWISDKEYNKHLSALFDLSKSEFIFKKLQPKEIGAICSDEIGDDYITDNGTFKADDQDYTAKRAFDKSGYCWRSCNLTSCSWIERRWDKVYTVDLIAIQASHLYEKATPTEFYFTTRIVDEKEGENVVKISEKYRSYDWMKDEWRMFCVDVPEEYKKKTKSVQIHISNNGGESFLEIQKIKIYGALVEEEEVPVN